MKTESITLRTVAAYAGVSLKTASRVVNDEPNVTAKTRDKVQEAIKKLQYKPNMAARQLKGNRSYNMALIYEAPASEYLTGILEGILPVCRENSYKLLLEPLAATDARDHILDMIERRVADGFILLPPLSEDISLIRSILNAKSEVVLVASTLNIDRLGLNASKVGIDDFSAGLEVGRYLIDRGHHCIGYVSLREQHNMANERGEGLKAALNEAGIKETNYLYAAGESSFESGYVAAKDLLIRDNRPTAIFAGNDYMAAGVIAFAKEIDLNVPNDLSVVGFDGGDLSKMFVPPFMTVEQPLKQYGQWAAKKLLSAINQPNSQATEESLDFTLIPRSSVRRVIEKPYLF